MEFDRQFFSSINYQTLLNISEQAADSLADANQQFRGSCVDKFDRRLQFLVQHFSGENITDIPEAEHAGWETVCRQIASAQQQYGGVILALFHFGMHRSILVDLACRSIPVVSPIAGKAYWDFYQQKHIAPAGFADCFNLVEVDSASVGKQLVKQMRKGRIVTIYVDGNMGPDGVHVSEGGIEVNFFGRKIHVKEGISRLASTFKQPVLPLFSLHMPNREHGYQIVAGELLPVTPELMQKLYCQLEDRIRHRPQDWEYITCCHRWLQKEADADTGAHAKMPETGTGFRLDPQAVRLVRRNDGVFLFNLKKQTAFKLPVWSTDLAERLLHGCSADDVQQWFEQDDQSQLKTRLFNELVSNELVTTSM